MDIVLDDGVTQKKSDATAAGQSDWKTPFTRPQPSLMIGLVDVF
jgi:hypothetical protein